MTRRHRKSRNFALILILFLFSVSVIGNVDSRLHIGGHVWEEDALDSGIEGVEPEPSQTMEPPSRIAATEDLSKVRSQEVFGIDVDARTFDAGTVEVPAVDSKALIVADVDTEKAESETALEESVKAAEAEAADTKGLAAEATSETAPSAKEESEPETEPAVQVAVEVPEVKEEPAPKPEPEPQRPSILVHTVRSGETLWDIANSYGISVDTILSANDIANSNRIQVGQELKVLTVKGVLHTVAVGESLWEISQRYKISMDEIVRANSISNPSRIQPATQIVIPGATQIRPRDVLVVNGQLQRAFDWPLRGRLSSPFGPRWGTMHNGIDLAVPTGTSVRAAADGRVTFSGWNGGYGYLVIIDHGNGVETRYAHHSRNVVQVGQRVERGQIVAYSGNTGNSTGPHLHFEIRYRGTPVDPQRYLR